ncbi:MAG: hypothetical protein AAGD96_10910 [Chloroflexota bacterium]
MFLLLRTISSYTNADLLLGVFSTEENAQLIKQQYINRIKADPKSDRWRDQGYRPDFDLEEDLYIVPSSEIEAQIDDLNPELVYVVSRMKEAYGQVDRELIGLYQNKTQADLQVNLIDNDPEPTFPQYSLVEQVKVGQLLPDDIQF